MDTDQSGRRFRLAFLMAAFSLVVLLVFITGRGPESVSAGEIEFVLEPLASGFIAPTDIAFDPANGKPHVAEKRGTIVLIADGAPGDVFLDISGRVASIETQQGLLSVVFHPDYALNRYFYVHYSDLNGDTQISRFTANPDLMTADPNSEFPILGLAQPHADNNGGDLAFGPDGYLYIPLGDGGDANDPDSNAQNGDTLLGKILRIDVDGGSPYAIPPDNPFVGDPQVLDEIWAFGMRNPWRISFDRDTGDLYIADVGQYEREEVNFQPAGSGGGENYGWSCFEGNLPNPDTNYMDCQPAGAYDGPFYDYLHDFAVTPNGCAVTGGYVYRGQAYPELAGRYLFTDWCTGYFWDAVQNGPGNWTVTVHDEVMGFGFVGLGEDGDGELYVVGNDIIYCLMGCVTEENIYLPVMYNGPPAIDLSLTGLEVSQSTQTMGMDVPLIADRPALLRIFAETSEAAATPNVNLTITAEQNGVPLAGSPLLFNNRSVVPDAHRSDLETTINVFLPAGWLQGDVDLQITLDPADTIIEWDEENNTQQMALEFNPVPPMNITIVPIRYTHTPNGQVYPPPTVDTLSNYLMGTYPVSTINVTFRTEYGFTGNLDLADEWRRLLNELTALYAADAPPPDVFYYGLVPVLNGSGAWFESGIAGIGWVGNNRVSAGLDLTPIWNIEYSGKLAAHEIGHNLNRLHAPCGVSTSLDPDYPYPDGKIGEYGVDVSAPLLYSPDNTYDFMSYCHTQWLSDYTYEGLLAELAAEVPAGPTGQQDSLLVRAEIHEDGRAEILPVYALPGRLSPLPENSDFTLEMLDASGRVLAAYPVQLLFAEEDGVKVEMIMAMLPITAGEDVATLRLLHHGRVLATRELAVQTPAADVLIGEGDVLRWSADRPVLVRYTADGGQTWLTLAVDADDELQLPAGLDLVNGDIVIIPSR